MRVGFNECQMDSIENVDKIDQILLKLSSSEVEALFDRLLKAKENLSDKNPNKRMRNSTGENSEPLWTTVVRRKGHKSSENTPSAEMTPSVLNRVTQESGTPVVLKNVPLTILTNTIAVSKVIKLLSPGASIRS